MTSTVSSSRSERPGALVPSDPEAIRARLAALGLRPTKRLGQSFLADPFVADAEAALVGPSDGGRILEIGGGLGILTEALLRRGIGPIDVAETDRRLVGHLRGTFGDRVRVLPVDGGEVPLDDYRTVIGNLPYSVATPILVRCFRARTVRVVALVQREVAERLGALPGTKAYGRLTLLAALFGTIELFRTVGPDAFVPPPAVTSRIVTFAPRDGPLPVDDPLAFEAAVRTIFSSRRKQLGNLLPRLHHDPNRLAERAHWPSGWERLRPEDLPPSDYFRLSEALQTDSPLRGRL